MQGDVVNQTLAELNTTNLQNQYNLASEAHSILEEKYKKLD